MHTKQVLSPQGVEGVLPSSAAIQVQADQESKRKDKGKQKMHEEHPTVGQDRDFILIEEDVIDLGSQGSRIKDMIIKEKEAKIQALSVNLERDKWVISYLEQENKQLTNKQDLMELQMIKENQQRAKKAKGKMTSIK